MLFCSLGKGEINDISYCRFVEVRSPQAFFFPLILNLYLYFCGHLHSNISTQLGYMSPQKINRFCTACQRQATYSLPQNYSLGFQTSLYDYNHLRQIKMLL
jgi:hypothetical protein